jgi:hypothetical protein
VEAILDAFGKAVIGLDIAFLLFLSAWLLANRRKRPRFWTIEGVPLSLKSAAGLLLALSVIAIVDDPIYRAAKRQAIVAGIPQAESAKISVLIPDFYGEGGAGVADQVRQVLQNGLGSGVQVLRVPGLPQGRRYGDVTGNSTNSTVQSFLCAKKYNGDVVIWGEYNKDTRLISAAYTATGGKCMPSNCGIASALHPPLHDVSALGNASSKLNETIFRGAISKLTMAMEFRGNAASAAQCLNDPTTLADYSAKADNLLKGDPQGLSEPFMVVAYEASSMFHSRAFEKTHNEQELNIAIARLQEVINRYPSQTYLVAGSLVRLWYEKTEFVTDVARLKRIARHVDGLTAKANEADVDQARDYSASMYERIYGLTGDVALRDQAEERHKARLRPRLSAEQKFKIYADLLFLRGDALDNEPGPENYRRAVIYRNLASSALRELTEPQIAKLPIHEKCRMARGELQLANVHLDYPFVMYAMERAVSLVPGEDIDWSDEDCVRTLHRLASLYHHAYERMGRSMPNRTQLLHYALDLEKQISANDKTGMTDEAHYWLGLAALRLGRATGSKEHLQLGNSELRTAVQMYQREGDTTRVAFIRRELGMPARTP